MGTPFVVRAKQCCDRVRAETGGRVDLQLFPNNILGGLTYMISMTRSGALQFVAADGITLSGVVPLVAIQGIGWAFKNAAQGLAAFDGELGDYVRNDIRSKGLYCYDRMYLNGMKQVTASPHPIAGPDDFHGFKIRVPPGALSVDLFRTLGASVTTMDVNQLYEALQTHVIDGQDNPLVNIEYQRLYEVQRYLSLTNHMWSGYNLIGNQDAWNALPRDLQAVLTRNFGIFATEQNRDVELLAAATLDKLQRQGLTANTPPAPPFRAQLETFYQKWKGEFGPTAWSLLEKTTGKLGS